MTESREAQIRRRAYAIWEASGRTGNPELHWMEAEIEVELDESQAARGPSPERDGTQADPAISEGGVAQVSRKAGTI